MGQVSKFVIRASITTVLVGFLVVNLDGREIWTRFQSINLPICLIMLASNVLLIGLFAKRWQLIAFKLGIEIPYFHYFRTTWISQFAGQFGPSLIVSEGARFLMVRQYGGKSRTAVSQMVDRLSGQIVLFGIILMVLPFYLPLLELSPAKQGVTALAALVAFALFVAWLSNRLCKQSEVKYRTVLDLFNPIELPKHYLVSLLIQVLLFVNFGLAAMAINVNVDIVEFFMLTPLVFGCLSLIPMTIADWGTREISALLILQSVGLMSEEVVSLSLVYGLIYLFATLPGALFCFQWKVKATSREYLGPVG